jgi:hypothetical protein
MRGNIESWHRGVALSDRPRAGLAIVSAPRTACARRAHRSRSVSRIPGRTRTAASCGILAFPSPASRGSGLSARIPLSPAARPIRTPLDRAPPRPAARAPLARSSLQRAPLAGAARAPLACSSLDRIPLAGAARTPLACTSVGRTPLAGAARAPLACSSLDRIPLACTSVGRTPLHAAARAPHRAAPLARSGLAAAFGIVRTA